MRQRQVKGVQRLALHSGIGDPAIGGVRDQWMSDGRHMHANLMGTAGMQRAAHQTSGFTVAQ